MRRWMGTIAGWLLPLRCRICAQPGTAALDLCLACQAAAVPNIPACTRCALPVPTSDSTLCGHCLQQPGGLDACHASWRYGPTLDVLVRRYKFQQDLAAGAALAGLMLQRQPPWLATTCMLMPVPLHRQRLAQRGYDQAHELAGMLAQTTGLSVVCGLQRQRSTAAQSGLDRAQRRRNLRNAFAVKPGAIPAQVVLVDDVMTTGATLEAAAGALRRAGATQVQAWVAARTV